MNFRLDPSDKLYIGSPGFGKDDGDYVEEEMTYCMGGPGIVMSRELLRSLSPHLPSCLKRLYTEHEDLELGRCIQVLFQLKNFANIRFSGAVANLMHQSLRSKSSFQAKLRLQQADRRRTASILFWSRSWVHCHLSSEQRASVSVRNSQSFQSRVHLGFDRENDSGRNGTCSHDRSSQWKVSVFSDIFNNKKI